VPSNIVAVVEVDDADTAMQLLHDSSQTESVALDTSVDSSRTSSQTSSYLPAHQGTSFTVMRQSDWRVSSCTGMY